MNMKKTIVCLLAMAVVVLCQSLTACKDPEPEHVHDWGLWGTPTPATATADSIATRTCATCGATATQPVAGHRETTITTLTFAPNSTAKIEGTLLLAEWNNVITQLPQIINTNYTEGSAAVQQRYDNVFAQTGNVITVEKTNEYENWKTDATGRALHLNYNTLSNWSSIMNNAVRALNEQKATQDATVQGGQWVE